MVENDVINHKVMREKTTAEYKRRLRLILKSELNAENMIEAIRTLAIPVLRYSFCIVNGRLAEI